MQSRIIRMSHISSVLPEGFDTKQVLSLVGEVITGFVFLGGMFLLPAFLRCFAL